MQFAPNYHQEDDEPGKILKNGWREQSLQLIETTNKLMILWIYVMWATRQDKKCTKAILPNLFLPMQNVPSAKYAANCVLASIVFAHNNIPEVQRWANRLKHNGDWWGILNTKMKYIS